MTDRTVTLTLVFAIEEEVDDEGKYYDASLVDISPLGTWFKPRRGLLDLLAPIPDPDRVCGVCVDSESNYRCQAHAVVGSINEMGAADWLDCAGVELRAGTLAITGKAWWSEIHGMEGVDYDEGFDLETEEWS